MAELVTHVRKMGFKSFALTDHGNVGGWIKFWNACKLKKEKVKDKSGKETEIEIVGADGKPCPPLKPLFGCEFYLARNHKGRGAEQPDGRKGNRHLILVAKNAEGYRNLCRLSQQSFTDGQLYDPRIDLNLLAEHSDGLICQSACLGSVINNNLLHARYDVAKRTASLFKDIFGRDFFLEAMYHGIDAEASIIPYILKLGKELDIPVICTNDCHYIKKEQAISQEVLMAMSTSKCLKDPRHLHFPYDEFYVKSAEEMGKIFGTHPELLLNTVSLAERVEDFLKPSAASGEDIIKMGGMRMPEIETQGLTPYQYLEKLAWEGLKKLKWDQSEIHVKALKMELADVKIAKDSNNMDFATYFLIVWDYINFARQNKILTGCGRGSGYASVLLRCLGITYGPDPLRYGLIWERFLGFDDKYFLLDSDWGFDEEETTTEDVVVVEADDDLDEAREVEDDMGGTDRY
jgi:DNA polymerase-3 subunit alpha